MELAARIAAARTDAGLTRPELAARVGCTKKAIELWEYGQRSDPGFSYMVRISRATGKPLDYFAEAIPLSAL